MPMTPIAAQFPWLLAAAGARSPTLEGPGDLSFTHNAAWDAQYGAADRAMVLTDRAARTVPAPSATLYLSPAALAGMPSDPATFLARANAKEGGIYLFRSHRDVQRTVAYVIEQAILGGGLAAPFARPLAEKVCGQRFDLLDGGIRNEACDLAAQVVGAAMAG